MLEPIEFFAEGIPKGQPRLKAFARGGHASVYDPGTAEGWKGEVALAAKNFRPGDPLIGPLRLALIFQIPRPKSHCRTGKNANELKPNSPVYHEGKPDADNYAKAVMDALTVLRFWQDDSQVAILVVHKLFSNGVTGCHIKISEAV